MLTPGLGERASAGGPEQEGLASRGRRAFSRKAGKFQHFTPEVAGVVRSGVVWRASAGLPWGGPGPLPRSWMISLHRVGGHGTGEDGELGAEVQVYAFNQLVSQRSAGSPGRCRGG